MDEVKSITQTSLPGHKKRGTRRKRGGLRNFVTVAILYIIFFPTNFGKKRGGGRQGAVGRTLPYMARWSTMMMTMMIMGMMMRRRRRRRRDDKRLWLWDLWAWELFCTHSLCVCLTFCFSLFISYFSLVFTSRSHGVVPFGRSKVR